MENNKCRNMHHGNALMANILNSMYRFRQMMPQCSCKHRNTCGQTPQQRSNHIAMLWVSHRQMVNKRDSPSMPMQHPLSQDKEIFLASRNLSKTCTCTGNSRHLRGKMNLRHRQWLSGSSITPGTDLMEIDSGQPDFTRTIRSDKMSFSGRGKTIFNQGHLLKLAWYDPLLLHRHKISAAMLSLSRILDQIGSHQLSSFLMRI